jgi:AcrR family transcriptional regulator
MATSMQDIAARAEVSLGTVYRHFPSLDELIPACGGRNMGVNPPPTAEVFEDLQSGEERVDAFFSAYTPTTRQQNDRTSLASPRRLVYPRSGDSPKKPCPTCVPSLHRLSSLWTPASKAWASHRRWRTS